jgi:hypothetical protein
VTLELDPGEGKRQKKKKENKGKKPKESKRSDFDILHFIVTQKMSKMGFILDGVS